MFSVTNLSEGGRRWISMFHQDTPPSLPSSSLQFCASQAKILGVNFPLSRQIIISDHAVATAFVRTTSSFDRVTLFHSAFFTYIRLPMSA